jgi:hypothetical protein
MALIADLERKLEYQEHLTEQQRLMLQRQLDDAKARKAAKVLMSFVHILSCIICAFHPDPSILMDGSGPGRLTEVGARREGESVNATERQYDGAGSGGGGVRLVTAGRAGARYAHK